MSTRTSRTLSLPAFVLDYNSMRRNGGRQVDWSYIPQSYESGATAVQLSAAALKGATSLSVDALTKQVDIGQVLDFGLRANVTVTVASDAAQGAVSISVSALSGPIPAGTQLDFGAGAGLFALVTARAATGATSLTVEALPEAIVATKTATYSGGRKTARATAKAVVGATSITVAALPFEIDDDDVAYFGGVPNTRTIPAGTVFVELASGLVVPRADRPGSETSAMISIAPIAENSEAAARSGWGFFIGGVIFETLLPEATGDPLELSSTYKTELAANGCTFQYQKYSDSRAS